jgi:hypothetical protein
MQENTTVVLIGTKLLNNKNKEERVKTQYNIYIDKLHDAVTKIPCNKTDHFICFLCKKDTSGYVYRIIVNQSYNKGERVMSCYGMFCSDKCLVTDIINDSKKQYEYRNPFYIDIATIVVNTNQKVSKDTGRKLDFLKIPTHKYVGMDIDKIEIDNK